MAYAAVGAFFDFFEEPHGFGRVTRFARIIHGNDQFTATVYPER